jgi:hypothetical protein
MRIPHGRASHECASRGIGMHLTGMCLMGVYLINVHLMSVHLTGLHLIGVLEAWNLLNMYIEIPPRFLSTPFPFFASYLPARKARCIHRR